jgi:hypothetical protein
VRTTIAPPARATTAPPARSCTAVTATEEPQAPDPRTPTGAQLDRLAAALANLDDAALRRGLTAMRESSRLEVAQHLNLSKATMHLGDALVPLIRRKVTNASPSHQLAVAFALTEQCNDETITALGDKHDGPTRADMIEILPDVIEHHGAASVALMLAAYGASDAKCQPVFAELLDSDERFALADPPARDDTAEEPPGITTYTRAADDPDQAEKRAQRKEAKAAKRAAAAQRKDAEASAHSARRQAQHQAKHRSRKA